MFTGNLQPQRTLLAFSVLSIWVVALGWAAGGGRAGQIPATTPPSTNKVKTQIPPPPPKVISPQTPERALGRFSRKAPARAVGAESTPSTNNVKAQTPSLFPKAIPGENQVFASGKFRRKEAATAKGAESTPTTKTAILSTGGGRRDPFKPPVTPSAGTHAVAGEVTKALPLGTRGLVISDLRVEGIVRQEAENKMIAVVTNFTKRAYFLRVNDTVHNGVVSKITPEAVYFKENTLDSSGRVATHEVELKLGSAPGEER